MTARDRMARAEDYVFGLMDEDERRRAERDMEIDAEFRQCVLELAQKLQRLHEGRHKGRHGGAEPPRSPDEIWADIAARIAELPQMAGVAAGRIGPAAAPGRPRLQPTRRRVGRGLGETGGRRGLVIACGIVAVFAIGYLVGYLR